MSYQIDLENAGRIENLRADELISKARAVYTAPGLAWEALEQARWVLDHAETRAEGVGAVRYDSDKVQTSVHAELADHVSDLLDAQWAVTESEHKYECAVMAFRFCLLTAYEMGLFNPLQVKMWETYYEHGHGREDLSLQHLADLYGVTKSKAQYLVTSPRAISNFCQAVDACTKGIETTTERTNNINTSPFGIHPCV